MKTPRLLPVVIAAGCALLALKSIGILTGGGYVLTGTTPAIAAGAAPAHGAPAAAAGGDGTPTIAGEPTIVDPAPIIADTSPTMSLNGEAAGGHGAPAADAHGAPAAPAERPPLEIDCPADPAAPAAAADSHATPAADAHGAPAPAAAPGMDGFNNFVRPANPGCRVDPGTTADGDALPSIRDGAGRIVPLAQTDPEGNSEEAILARLSERREVLDTRESELDMRLALVEAAEKRIAERSAALEALEARINGLVEDKKTADEAQFTGIVAMYETMKPKDAAAILNELEMPVLLRLVRAMNPRKMAPIMAAMDPIRAKNLTAGMAADQSEPTIEMAGTGLDSLPAIVGQ